MSRAALYLRVSTREQKTDAQEAELRSWASRLGLEVGRVYADTASGARGDRGALAELLVGGHQREFDTLLVWALDRLSREGIGPMVRYLDELRGVGLQQPPVTEGGSVMDLREYQGTSNNYAALSLKDLLEARDTYHVHLMEHPNVVGTAVGRYRIRNEDSWPDEKGPGVRHGTGERTLENSEVRPYSWPAVLVFVDRWADAEQFSAKGDYDPDEMVPRTLYLADERRVPVCIMRSPRELGTDVTALPIRYPLNNIGGGYPVLMNVQGREHVATIACLVSDGHTVYAFTNRHVTGEGGEIIYSQLGGKVQRIGVAAPQQLTRIPQRAPQRGPTILSSDPIRAHGTLLGRVQHV